MVSIDYDEDTGRIKSIYQGTRSGDRWTTLPDGSVPEVTETGVSIEYFFDPSTEEITAETTANDDSDLL
jgi:hypothetical protein